jgi:oleate hydratase
VTADPRTANVWMVGGGIASMSAAAFLIRDAGVPGENIHILETLDVPDGSLDGAASPVQAGYVTRGGRMLEEEAYRCLWNLLESVPRPRRPRQVRAARHRRLQLPGHDARSRAAQQFRPRDPRRGGVRVQHARPMELMRLLALSEHALGTRRIDEMFSRHFFTTNFWQMWRTTFAFQNWHSAVELRRYFIRFVHEFPRIPRSTTWQGRHRPRRAITNPVRF